MLWVVASDEMCTYLRGTDGIYTQIIAQHILYCVLYMHITRSILIVVLKVLYKIWFL